MRVSELAAASGVTVATIKYYLREGLLMPGEATGATQARYDEKHLRRIRLIKALADVAGLPMQQVRVVLGLIDTPEDDMFDTLGKAVGALPPYDAGGDTETDDYPRARAVIERLGQIYDPRYAAVAQLERALQAVADVGLPLSDERLEVYAAALRSIAELELRRMPESSPADAVEYAVLGTALYEPVILAMRRLAHQDLAARMLTGKGDGTAAGLNTPKAATRPAAAD